MNGLSAKTLGDFRIKEIPFSERPQDHLSDEPKSSNWPVVYLLAGRKNQERRVYIGETSNFCKRLKQHKNNPDRQYVSSVQIIFDDHYTKSAVLDIEQSLIRLFAADGMYVLDNRNAGQSAAHNYYQRELYQLKLPLIWEKLRQLKLSSKSYDEITNSNLYTYSPFTALTEEQNEICRQAFQRFVECLENGSPASQVITGTAGTGKTIVAINLMKLVAEVNATNFSSIQNESLDIFNDEDGSSTSFMGLMHRLRKYIEKNGPLNIGYVVYMESLRKTLRKVFNDSRKNGALTGSMVLGPYDLFNNANKGMKFDLLIVDEAHRLPRYKNLLPTAYNRYRDICQSLNLDYEKASTLDWIIKKSHFQVLFYDASQSVRPGDLTEEQFNLAVSSNPLKLEPLELTVQMRCAAGSSYINYIQELLTGTTTEKKSFQKFDFYLFDDVEDMAQTIRRLDRKKGMICRNIAGYAWDWKTKGKTVDEINAQGLSDIEIDSYRYVWNTTASGWILSKNAINEIGCVHTTQGFDLSYVGVIIGPEIDYIDGKICIDKNKVKDTNTRRGADEHLHDFIINTYKVLLSRGIHGCFVYACNEGLRNYLKQFIETFDEVSNRRILDKVL